MSRIGEEISTILLAIIGVAILAVIVSKNANTTKVIESSGKAFSQALATAISPVTGNSVGMGLNM